MSKTKRQIIDESVSDTDASWVEVAMQAWADQKLEEYKERLKKRIQELNPSRTFMIEKSDLLMIIDKL